MTEPSSDTATTTENDAMQQQRRQADEKIQRMLQQAGLQAYPIDPVSLDALRGIVQKRDDKEETPAAADAAALPAAPTAFSSSLAETMQAGEQAARPTAATMDRTPPPAMAADARNACSPWPDLYVDELADHRSLDRYAHKTRWPRRESEASKNAPIFLESTMDDPNAPFEDRVLQQLHQQTLMLHRLQKQVDELREQVRDIPHQQTQQALTQQFQPQGPPVVRTSERILRPVEPLQPMNVAGAAAVPRPPAMHLFSIIIKRVKHLNDVDVALRNVYMPNFNIGLLVKVLFILCIIMARMGASSNKRETPEEATIRAFRMIATIAAVVAGFLVHSGAAKVFYVFFKENYLVRILWEGVEFDIAELVRRAQEEQHHRLHNPGQPLPPPLAAAGDPPAAPIFQQQPPAAGWQAGILAGRLPRPQDAGALAPLLEIIIFFATFFLSIFPQWQPDALEPIVDDLDDDDSDDDDDDLGNENEFFDNLGRPRGEQAPNARPPRDAFEPLDDGDY
ncbi:hypothetical protein MPSEU_000641800 [Mayamaea pseudoterrestris]|nr:hypothetical protein MPSEU_000641800 [Mayamaea pseudoterrestris]